MSSIPYHQAKEIIEQKTTEYTNRFEGIELSKISVERKQQDTIIDFLMNKDTDMYNIVETVVGKIGDMRISQSFGSSLYLGFDNGYVYVSKGYENSFRFIKKGDLTSEEIDAIIETYKTGNSVKNSLSPRQRLLSYGVKIYDSNKGLTWDYISGYEDVKQEIKDTVILPLQHPEIYERIATITRKKFEHIRPKAVLFEGPSGTGKTTSARIIAGETEIPMVYVPIESIMTKWYGESERNLSGIFDACNDLDNAIIFLDEIDSLATSRERGIHEATRRVLSVLLRKIDGFEPNNKTILIGATNMKDDLDPALISRFDTSIYFHLPNLEERIGIFGNYAVHLNDDNLEELAQKSDKFSGRNIKDICEQSERKWASKILRSEESNELPPLEEYLRTLEIRNKNGTEKRRISFDA